jgi:hypothetical protein
VISRVKTVEISLPDALRNSSTFVDDPFIVYVQKNFMEQTAYDQLISELEESFTTLDFLGTSEKKWFRIESHRRPPRTLGKTIVSFCEAFSTAEFRKWFIETHEVFFERGKLASRFPSSRLSMFLTRALNYVTRTLFGLKLWNIYATSVELSFLPTGGSVPPHTDASQKRMALVFFTPFKPVSEIMRAEWGTEFWRAKSGIAGELSWHTNTKIGADYKDFLRKHEVFLKVPYEANSICGFIKGDRSWHSVRPNALEDDRIAVVINIWDLAPKD